MSLKEFMFDHERPEAHEFRILAFTNRYDSPSRLMVKKRLHVTGKLHKSEAIYFFFSSATTARDAECTGTVASRSE